MKKPAISLKTGRMLAIHAQLLDGNSQLPSNKEGIAEAINRLGYVQIDTIAVVARSHHHTLWTRCPIYHPEMLHKLQTEDRRIFEYWTHAVSYLPISDYRYYLPRMKNFKNTQTKWVQELIKRAGNQTSSVLERIRQEGPLSSKDFKNNLDESSKGWWDWKPAKAALELLYWNGELMISERRQFQKYYDIPERILPRGIDTTYPDDDELGEFFVRRTLSAFGVAQEREFYRFMQPEPARDAHFHAAGKDIIIKSLDKLVESGEVTQVEIQGCKSTDYYTLTETLEKSTRLKLTPNWIHFLSPFDNLIIQRERIKHLFNFHYVLECYVPAPKRKYGYFSFPILWNTDFIGRLDPKADRKIKTLIVRNLIFEPHVTSFDLFLPQFADKLKDFARFNQCHTILLENTKPAIIKSELYRLIKKALQG